MLIWHCLFSAFNQSMDSGKESDDGSDDRSTDDVFENWKDDSIPTEDRDDQDSVADGEWDDAVDESENKTKTHRAKWSESDLTNLIDIIINDESLKKKLIFLNTKNSTNTICYENIIKSLKGRDKSFNFSVIQVRNRFKKCISICKEAALKIQTSSGIKRFQDDKNYGDWFTALYPVIRSRESCNPELCIEPPSKLRRTENGTDFVNSPSTPAPKQLFVPTASKKKKIRENDSVERMVDIMKTCIESDPTKDLLKFLKDDIEKSREHELQVLKIIMGQNVPQQNIQNPCSQQVPYQYPAPMPRSQVPSTTTYLSPFKSNAPTQNSMQNYGQRPDNPNLMQGYIQGSKNVMPNFGHGSNDKYGSNMSSVNSFDQDSDSLGPMQNRVHGNNAHSSMQTFAQGSGIHTPEKIYHQRNIFSAINFESQGNSESKY